MDIQTVKCLATESMIGVRFPARVGLFFRRHVQTGSGVIPTSYPIEIVGSFAGGKEDWA